jgi:hypothetical protein
MMSKIEQDLYDYLSPVAQREVDDYLRELDDEAIELMVREPKVEPDEDDLRDEARFVRNTEPQDSIPSGAVKSDR